MTNQPMSSEEMLACPFCGGGAVTGNRNNPFGLSGMHTNGPSWFTIGCPTCGFLFCEQDFNGPTRRAQTIAKWNTRKQEPGRE
jgi:hypothetical protein